MQPRIQRGVHLLFLLPLSFILFPATKKSPVDRPSFLDYVLAAVSLVPALYIIYFNEPLNQRMQMVSPVDTIAVVLGVVNIILIIEAIRRVVVPAMAILVSAFIAYTFVAPYLPGIFYSRPLRFSRLVEMNYLLTDTGIYGSITGVTATFVAIFVIFGSFMEQTKPASFLRIWRQRSPVKDPAVRRRSRFGVPGCSVSISGVASANVYATGTFTIPLMKKLGYRPQFAGAVEAAASTGGLIMPPIMGAGAFVMSEITNIPYVTIAAAAALGAILYYVSIGLRVHFIALKDKLKSLDPAEMISWKQVLKDSYLLLPLVVLITLLVIGYSPFGACTFSILASFLLSFLRKDTMLTPRRLFGVFEKSGYNCIMLAVTCAGAGLVVSVVTYTGLALGIATVITSFSGGFLLPALILVMITSLIMGMGLPCTPAYIIAVTIGGPAMLGSASHAARPLVRILLRDQWRSDASVCIASYFERDSGTSRSHVLRLLCSPSRVDHPLQFFCVYQRSTRRSPLESSQPSLLMLNIFAQLSAYVLRYLFVPTIFFSRFVLESIDCALVVLASNVRIMEQLVPQLVIIFCSVAAVVAFFALNNRTKKKLEIA
jgi:TRAP transporter 4TM/12TM fusion protein